MKYDAMYFLKKFDAIPERRWTTGTLKNEAGQCCALGHCGTTDWDVTMETVALRRVLCCATSVNDGVGGYSKLGDTPRERIMNALLLVNAGVEL